MRVLVLGSTGMLGQALVRTLNENGYFAQGLARRNADFNCDITEDDSLVFYLNSFHPDIIINCAAMINLQKCEDNPGFAYLVNARPLGVLLNYSRANGIKLVQISTDHYFTGDKDYKHNENAPVYLLNEYSRTKYLGEKFALESTDALVIRTNIVGFRGWNEQPTFVEWVFNELKNDHEITAFEDYFTSSITVTRFSAVLIELLKKNVSGLINVGSRDVFSKRDLIENLAFNWGYFSSKIVQSSIKKLNGVQRCESLGLDVSQAESILGITLPTFKEVIDELSHNSEGVNGYYEME